MAQTMLESLSCVRIEPPSRFGPQPISSDMDERAIRFELERQACQSLRQVLQLKLQQRRSREELVNQGIMPPLKSSAAFHEQRRCLERARTEDYLKRKIRSRPERSELIRMHILQEASSEPLLQAKQLQLKRARLAIDLNDKISHRPGPMELIHKNILPVHSSIKQAFIETDFPKASTDNSSCDEDSIGSLSPQQPGGRGSPLGLPSPSERRVGSSIPSPKQAPPPAPILPQTPGSSHSLTNGAASAQRLSAVSPIKPKSNCDRSAQRHKKPKDNKPKIRKLKYHQYIPPDQKGDKEPPPHLDSSYAKILQQQQLFLQLQILNQQQQQQQNYNYHAILPAPSKPQSDQQASSSSSSSSSITSTATPSPPQPAAAPSATYPTQSVLSHLCSSSSGGGIPACLPPNLDEMKVAELKSELKLRSLTVSGTKNDLIERLRTYQELNGGVAAATGGGASPEVEGADGSPATTPTPVDKSSPQQFQFHQPPPLIAEAGDRTAPTAASPQQLLASGGAVSPPLRSLSHPERPLEALSPEERSIASATLGGKMRSRLPTNQKQASASQFSLSSKEEHLCSIPAPCQLSMKLASVPKHCPAPLAAPTAAATAPVLTVDKDRMLREKDKQIEELTRMLRQKQRLVDVLRMQLEHGRRPPGQAPESVVLVRVKQEPHEKPSGPPTPPSLPCDADVSLPTVKQEASVCGTRTSSPGAQRSLQPSSKSPEEQIPQNKTQQTHVVLQQTALQLAQQQAIQKLLLQKQLNSQNPQQQQQHQTPRNHQDLQKLAQQRKKKSHKQQLKLQRQQEKEKQQHQQTKQHQQQLQLKQQILLKQHKSLLQHQAKQPEQTQIQTKVQQQQQQQQPPQVTQAYKHSGSAPSFPLDLLKSSSTPTLVTDSNGNHFLIALTNHVSENQRTDAVEGKAATPQLPSTPASLPGGCPAQATKAANPSKQNTHVGFLKQQISKVHKGRLQVSADQARQGAAHSLSSPPAPQPFFKELGNATAGKKAAAPSPQTDIQPEDGFIDIILQAGEISSSFQPAPGSSLDHPNPTPSPAPPSPLGMLLSPPVPAATELARTPAAAAASMEEKAQPADSTSGRLEDFLESTTGKPLLGVEPGGLLTLIDDLHSQMLCTPSILDHPTSPMDTFDVSAEGEQGLNGMDWLDFTMGEERGEEPPTLAPLAPQTPTSVFSTDFLDSYDLQIHWDSCL